MPQCGTLLVHSHLSLHVWPSGCWSKENQSLEKGWDLLQLGAHLDWLPRGHLPPWAVRVLFSELGLPVTGHRSGNGWA